MKKLFYITGASLLSASLMSTQANALAEVRYEGTSTFVTYVHNCLWLAGNDEIRITAPHVDLVSGCSGDDVMNGSTVADQIFGSGGADTLNGNGGNDNLHRESHHQFHHRYCHYHFHHE